MPLPTQTNVSLSLLLAILHRRAGTKLTARVAGRRAGEDSEHTEARLDAIMGMLEGMHDAAQAPPPTPKKEPTNRP